MSIEAIKQMVEALEKAKRQCQYHNIAPHLCYEDAIQAGRQAIAEAEKQEPVAKDQWWVKELEGFWGSAGYKVTLDTRRAAKTALTVIFDHPQPAQPAPVQDGLLAVIKSNTDRQIEWDNRSPEEQWVYHEENACPYCGGSGHKDDVKQEQGEPVAHCEAGPSYCWKCLEEAKPTYGSEEIRKLREVIASQAKIIEDHIADTNKMVNALQEIDDFAHDNSTGPAVPDALWEIRSMAYNALVEQSLSNGCTTPQPAQPEAEQCTWEQSNDPHMPDTWEADCGAVWTFTEGGPKDNDMKFCPSCGKPLIEAAHGIKE